MAEPSRAPPRIPSDDPMPPDVRTWLGVQRRDWVVMAIVPSLFLAGMTSTFTDLARPFVVSEMASDRYRYQWVLGTTLFGSVAGMSLMPWIRSRFGLKRCYVSGLIVFTLGSLACALAPNMELLGVARFVQGWGNGMVVTTVLAVFWREFPDHRDGATAVYVLGLYFGRIVAPSFSGFLINLPSWRSIFFFNVPVGAIGAALTYELLRRDEPEEGTCAPFDIEGLMLLVGWVFCLMIGLFRFQKWGWSTANEFWLVTPLGLALFAGFVASGLARPCPLVDLGLFAHRRFALSVAIKAMADLNFFTVISLLVRYMAVTRDYERTTTGLVLLPAVLTMAATLAMTAMWGTRADRKPRLVLGLSGMALGTWILSGIDLYTDKLWTCGVTAAWAAAAGLVASPLICISQEDMTPQQVASSSSIKNLMLVLPAFVGNNLAGIFIERRGDAHFDAIRQTLVPNRPPVGDVFRQLVDYYLLNGLGPAEADRQARAMIAGFARDYAGVFAYQAALQVLAAVMLAAIVLALTLRPLPPHATGPMRG